MVTCEAGEQPVVNQSLGVGLCLPAGWGAWEGGSDPAPLSNVENRAQLFFASPEWFPYPDPTPVGGIPPDVESRLGRSIRVRISFAPDDLLFGGCTPSASSQVSALLYFCEDVYDVVAGGAVYGPEGALTAWKFLQPVGRRVIRGGVWESGRIYVKAVFESANRDGAIPRVLDVLSTLVIQP